MVRLILFLPKFNLSLNPGCAPMLTPNFFALIIVSFIQLPEKEVANYKPKLVYVNEKNKQVEVELVDGKLVRLLG